jgi:hypothetical protein
MKLDGLPAELRAIIATHALAACLQSLNTQGTASHIYALFTAAEIAVDGDRLLLSRSATRQWLGREHGTSGGDTAVARIAAQADRNGGTEFRDALHRILRGHTTSSVAETTVGVRRLLAVTLLVGTGPDWPTDRGQSLACTALFTLPLLVRLAQQGETHANDSLVLAPFDPERLWVGEFRFDVRVLCHKLNLVPIEELLTRCKTRWKTYCKPVKPRPLIEMRKEAAQKLLEYRRARD